MVPDVKKDRGAVTLKDHLPFTDEGNTIFRNVGSPQQHLCDTVRPCSSQPHYRTLQSAQHRYQKNLAFIIRTILGVATVMAALTCVLVKTRCPFYHVPEHGRFIA